MKIKHYFSLEATMKKANKIASLPTKYLEESIIFVKHGLQARVYILDPKSKITIFLLY